MLVGDMTIENFAGLPDFEDLPKNMQVEAVDGFVVIPDKEHEVSISGRTFFKFALCKNETPFCIKHVHADILSLYDTGWQAIYLSKSGYMYFYNYDAMTFSRKDFHCSGENGVVGLIDKFSKLNDTKNKLKTVTWDYYGLVDGQEKLVATLETEGK